MNVKPKHVVLGFWSVAGTLALAACGYVKVFDGTMSQNFEWSAERGYQVGDNDAEIVALCAQSLSDANITFATGDSAAAVTDDFTLPATLGDCAVSWAVNTDGAAWISVDGTTATVTRQTAAANGAVTLTATLTKGAASETKDIAVTVERQVTNAEAVATCKSNLSTATFDFASGDTASLVSQNFTLPDTQNDCSLTWIVDNTTWVPSINATTFVATIARQQAVANQAVTFTATISRNSSGSDAANDTKGLSVTILRALDNAEVDACATALTAADITFTNPDTSAGVTSNFTLPSTMETSGHTCFLSWAEQVDAKNAIVVSGYNATVTRPSYTVNDASVTLRATVSGGYAAYHTTQDVSFTVTRLSQTDAEAVAADKAALAITFGGIDNVDSVTQTLTLPATGADGSAIAWASSDTSHIPNGSAGTVTRGHSLDGSHTPVTLTATITKNGVSDIKAFNLTVLTLGTLSATPASLSSGAGSSKMSVQVDAATTVTDGANAGSIRYRVCVAVNGAGLESIAAMDAISLSGSCSTDINSPLIISDLLPVCCTAVTATTNQRFLPPAGTEEWKFKIYSYVLGDPSQDHHKFLYNISDPQNP